MTRTWTLAVWTTLGLAILQQLAAADQEKKKFDDAEFLRKAISGGMLEIRLAKLGQTKAGHAEVKKFAGQLEADHNSINADLAKIAEATGVDVPKKLATKQQETLDKFKEFTGRDFDRAYMKHMVDDHEGDAVEFKRAMQEANSTELRQFAARALPMLEEHLKRAKAVEKQIE